MKVLVTGASGFIGSNLTKRLIEQSNEVFYAGCNNENPIGGQKISEDFGTIDFSKLPKIDVIFHEAAITDTLVKNRKEMFRVNTDKSIYLFKQAILHGCRQIVYASSCSIYGNAKAPFKEDAYPEPLNPYAESKLELDNQAMQLQGANIIGLRYSNVYGPGETHKRHYASMIHKLIQQIKRKENPILYEWGDQKRDFVYIEDIIDINLIAAKTKVKGIFNAGSGCARSFNEIVEIIKRLLRSKVDIDYIRNPFEESFQNHTECDMSKTKNTLGFEPKWGAEEGIDDFLKKINFI